MLATTFLFTSLLGPLHLCVVAGVYFDPDVYTVNEGDAVTLILKTNVTVNKRFSVLVNTRDDSANSTYPSHHIMTSYVVNGIIQCHFIAVTYMLSTFSIPM